MLVAAASPVVVACLVAMSVHGVPEFLLNSSNQSMPGHDKERKPTCALCHASRLRNSNV